MSTRTEQWAPLPVTRAAVLSAGVLFIAIGGLFVYLGWTNARLGWPFVVLGILGVTFGVPTAWRAQGMKVVLEADAVTIHGTMWTRRIDKGFVRDITTYNSFPTIRWETDDGKPRSTPVWIISKNGLGRYGSHARSGEKLLSEWARSREPVAGSGDSPPARG